MIKRRESRVHIHNKIDVATGITITRDKQWRTEEFEIFRHEAGQPYGFAFLAVFFLGGEFIPKFVFDADRNDKVVAHQPRGYLTSEHII